MKKRYILLIAILAHLSLQAQDDPDLLGSWFLHYTEANGTTTYANSSISTYEMTINNSGAFEAIFGYSACNAFAGDYQISNNNTTLSILGYTETLGFCDDLLEHIHLGIMATAITNSFEYAIDAQTGLLTLTDHQGRKLVYGRQVLSTQDNAAFSNRVKLYPNPVQKELFVTGILTNTKTTYSIYNIVGNVVITERSLKQESLDVTKLKAGIYFIQIHQQGKIAIKKFVKL